MKIFIKSFLAGMLITLSVTVYLLIENKYLGSFLFSFGLITILVFKFYLYTGKVGYIINEKASYILKVLLIAIGNALGCIVTSFLIMNTRIYETFKDSANLISAIKLSDDFLSILILSIFCGVLMFIAVDNFKTKKEDNSKYFIVVLAVMVFLLSSFEHSIANIAYLNYGNLLFTIDGLLFILVVLLGNAIGTMIIPLCKKAM